MIEFNEDDNVVVCPKLGTISYYVPGGEVRECLKCGCKVAVAPSSLDHIFDPKFLCIPCGVEIFNADPNPKIGGTPEFFEAQAREIEHYLHRD